MARFANLRLTIAIDLLIAIAITLAIQLYRDRQASLAARQPGAGALDRDVPSLVCDGEGFESALDKLRAQTGVNFVVRWALDVDPPLGPQTPVHVRLQHVPVRAALRALLDSVGKESWDFGLCDNVVVLGGEYPLYTIHVYNVADLVDPQTPAIRQAHIDGGTWSSPDLCQQDAMDRLVDFCKNQIDKDPHWDPEGGLRMQGWDDMLVVSLSPSDQERMIRLLAKLRSGELKLPPVAPYVQRGSM